MRMFKVVGMRMFRGFQKVPEVLECCESSRSLLLQWGPKNGDMSGTQDLIKNAESWRTLCLLGQDLPQSLIPRRFPGTRKFENCWYKRLGKF